MKVAISLINAIRDKIYSPQYTFFLFFLLPKDEDIYSDAYSGISGEKRKLNPPGTRSCALRVGKRLRPEKADLQEKEA